MIRTTLPLSFSALVVLLFSSAIPVSADPLDKQYDQEMTVPKLELALLDREDPYPTEFPLILQDKPQPEDFSLYSEWILSPDFALTLPLHEETTLQQMNLKLRLGLEPFTSSSPKEETFPSTSSSLLEAEVTETSSLFGMVAVEWSF